MLFFHVAEVDSLAAKAKQLQGSVHLEPMSAGTARLAVLAGPQGAAFSIIQPPVVAECARVVRNKCGRHLF
jgi:predicted enzyme related to lactoylglutathione lyase